MGFVDGLRSIHLLSRSLASNGKINSRLALTLFHLSDANMADTNLSEISQNPTYEDV